MEKGGAPPQYNTPPPAYTQTAPGNYYPQQTGYPQQQQSATVVVTGQPTVVPLQQQFREVPVRTQCQQCRADILTTTQYETGMFTWMVVGGMCFILFWFGLCCFALIPFCIKSCKDVVHTCPNCQGVVGKYNRAS